MVNYKRVVCEVAVVAVLAAVAVGAPVDCKHDVHYDQRQNGSENYRLNIDGVVIAVAPADSLLAAASELDLSDLLDFDELNELHKPKPPVSEAPIMHDPVVELKPETKPDDAKEPAKIDLSDVSLNSESKGQKKDASTRKQEKVNRLKNKIAHLLLPLLRRNRHH